MQTKVAVSNPGDRHEQEADRISQQAMRMPEPRFQVACSCGGGRSRCQTGQPSQEHERLQPKRLQPGNVGQTVPPTIREVLASPGQPLDAAARAFFEPRFGYDFSRVRVHAGPRAAEAAGSISADAFTAGQHVVMGRGHTSAQSVGTRWLLAHELTHIIQQADGRSGALSGLGGGLGARRVLEQDASDQSERVISGGIAPFAALPRPSRAQQSPQPIIAAGPIQCQPRSQPGEPEPDCDLTRQEFLLTYVGWPGGRNRCITTADQEFRDNYIDANIVLATAQFTSNTTWENVDISRVAAMVIEYRDGSKKEFNANDIPALPTKPVGRRAPLVGAGGFVDRYERRSDGLIYPIRWGEVAFDKLTTPNLILLRSGLSDYIADLQFEFLLIEAGAQFAGNIATLGGFAAMNHDFARGGMFEPVPKKKGATTADPHQPGTPRSLGAGEQEHEQETGTASPKPTSATKEKPTQKLLSSKVRTITSDIDPKSVKENKKFGKPLRSVYEAKKVSVDPDVQAEVRMAEHLADDGHKVHFNEEGRRTTSDLTVDDVATDVKQPKSKDSIHNSIMSGKKQAEQVAIDGTAIGLSEADARNGVRAFEVDALKRPGSENIKRVYFLLGNGKVFIYDRTTRLSVTPARAQ